MVTNITFDVKIRVDFTLALNLNIDFNWNFKLHLIPYSKLTVHVNFNLLGIKLTLRFNLNFTYFEI